jgi:hypothetical protein
MRDSPHLPLFHVVGFSGHRLVERPAEAGDAIKAVIESLRGEGSGEWIALSSVAAGADSLFARQALGLGLAWHALLPLPPAEFRRDFSPGEWKAAEALLSGAEHTRVLSESGSRQDAYLDCGMETVNECDVLLALWDGEPARGKGGTGDVITYARELGKPIVVINAATLEVSRENFAGFSRADHVLHSLNSLPEAPSRPDTGQGALSTLAAIILF